jgi:hypothetical protein
MTLSLSIHRINKNLNSIKPFLLGVVCVEREELLVFVMIDGPHLNPLIHLPYQFPSARDGILMRTSSTTLPL